MREFLIVLGELFLLGTAAVIAFNIAYLAFTLVWIIAKTVVLFVLEVRSKVQRSNPR